MAETSGAGQVDALQVVKEGDGVRVCAHRESRSVRSRQSVATFAVVAGVLVVVVLLLGVVTRGLALGSALVMVPGMLAYWGTIPKVEVEAPTEDSKGVPDGVVVTGAELQAAGATQDEVIAALEQLLGSGKSQDYARAALVTLTEIHAEPGTPSQDRRLVVEAVQWVMTTAREEEADRRAMQDYVNESRLQALRDLAPRYPGHPAVES